MKKKTIYSFIALTSVFVFLLSSSVAPALAQPAGGGEPTGICTGPQCEPANGNFYTTDKGFLGLGKPVCCGKATTDDIGSQDIGYHCNPDNPCNEETCPICNPEQH